MTNEHQAFANILAPLFSQLALAAAPGGIVLTYTFDGQSQTMGDPGSGKWRLNNATQGSATALVSDALDNLGVSAVARLALLTSSSAIKGTVFIYQAGDPTKWMLATATAVTASGGGTGYSNIALSNVQVSTANPFTDGKDVVMILVPKGDKGDQGIQGPSSVWAADQSYTVSGSPTAITLALPSSSAASCRIFLDNITLSASSTFSFALSTDGGSTFGGAITFGGGASNALFSGALLLEGIGRSRLNVETRYVAGGSIPSSPNALNLTSTALEWVVTGGATHVRFTANGGATFASGSITTEKK